MTSSARSIVVGLLLCVGSAACGGGDNPVTPDPVLSTETFTGTITSLGTAAHAFVVNYGFSYTPATFNVTSLVTVATGASQNITIGVGFGQPSVGVCTKSAALTNPAAPVNTELGTPEVFGPGNYCIQLFDNPDGPTVTEPLNYSITVKHY